MWIALNDSFVSVVEDGQRPGNLLVRSRRREHLKALFPRLKPTVSPRSDYRYRLSLPRATVAERMMDAVLDIDYGNFKSSTTDKTLHDMYSLWWGDHHKIQR